MSNVSTKKASNLEMRQQREIVDYMTKRGMRFVAVPVLNDADFLYLSSLVRVRLDALEKQAEKRRTKVNNDDRCYCNFTGNCPYCNENFFKEKYGMIVTPAMAGQENSPITVWNDFELRAYFENDPDTYYVISTIYKNNLNSSGREGYINMVYKYEEKGEMPLGIDFIWETHVVTTDWRKRVLFVLEKYFDMEV